MPLLQQSICLMTLLQKHLYITMLVLVHLLVQRLELLVTEKELLPMVKRLKPLLEDIPITLQHLLFLDRLSKLSLLLTEQSLSVGKLLLLN